MGESLSPASLEAFLEEVREALDDLQPGLEACIYKGEVLVEGQLLCTGSAGPFDTFDIRAIIQEGYPGTEPAVWEVGNRIPKIANRHIYPDSGKCCICVWEEWLWKTEDMSFREYLSGPLHSYFVSQSYYELKGGEWPFGDRAHDKAGILQAYARILDLDDQGNVESYLTVLVQKQIKGHNRCPCGSGKRVRNCHRGKLERLRVTISSALLKRMHERLQIYCRT